MAMRKRYPDWGARKLQVMLRRRGVEIPSTTIHRILLRQGLVREVGRHQEARQRFERSAPNELWQMDFKGPLQRGDKLGPLSVLDDHSRYLVALRQVASTNGELVREHLEDAFRDAGVPRGDANGSWHSVVGPFSAAGADKAGAVDDEARHRTALERDSSSPDPGEGRAFPRRVAACRRLSAAGDGESAVVTDGFRWEHNYVRPHEALGMQTPASQWRPSAKRYDPNPSAWQYPEGSRVLKIDGEGKIKLHQQHWFISQALSGEHVQLVTIESRVLVYYCRTLIRELDPLNQQSTIVNRSFAIYY